MQNVTVLYSDETDRKGWNEAFRGMSHVMTVTAENGLTGVLEGLRAMRENLRVAVISSRLYPYPHPGLVGLLRELNPDLEVLLISREACAPPLKPLLEDRIRHLCILPGQEGVHEDRLPAVIDMLLKQRGWDISCCLKEGTVLHSYRLSSSDDKEDLIAKLEELLSGEGEEMELLRQKGALLADELLENAMYDAPRSGCGDRLFSKGERRSMLPREDIVFSFGFDGETLSLALTDNWGSLDPDEVLEYLTRNEEDVLDCGDPGGRGLFIVWRFLDRFHVAVTPGHLTRVGGQLHLRSTLTPEAPRGFHIMNGCEEVAA
ncbi:hypothetical protein [Geomonas oryzae]|uniref:hypothetical protein n=1 Tax=Geomonas oryzae TaxID=2364273 RepID=UPI00100B4240|nr:hypothetical protein [Geomonas oryzae]